jgi:hypothetical protein
VRWTRDAIEAELSRALAPERLPEERAAAIREALRTADLHVQPRRRRWIAPLAAMFVLAPALVLWKAAQAPRLAPAPPGEPAAAFERMAVALHERGDDHSGGAVLRTASPAEARAWGRARTGVDVNLPAARPAEDDGRFALHAIAAVQHRGKPALAVWYEVDGRPVTLAVAHAADVPDGAPAWTLAGKSVRSRRESGHGLLSWTNSGQSYVLVSDLPGDGRRACFVCHTQPARRSVIDRLAP